MVKLLSVGDCVVSGKYSVHSRFSKVINFVRVDQHDEWILSVVTKEVGEGPYSIVVEKLDDFSEVLVTDSTISFNSKESFTKVKDIYCSEIPSLDLEKIDKNMELFHHSLLKYINDSPLLPIVFSEYFSKTNSGFEQAVTLRLKEGIDRINSGNIIEGLRLIKGVGTGLTPSGDDFISGVLIGINLLSKLRQIGEKLDTICDEIFTICRSENRVSNSILYASKRGLLSSHLLEFLKSLSTSDEYTADRVRESIKRVSFIGHSSGLDSLAGLYFSLKRKEIWL